MALLILRCALLAVALGLAVMMVNAQWLPDDPPWMPLLSVAAVLGGALLVIVGDVAWRKKRLDVISAVYFGLVVGLFLAYIAGLALSPLLMRVDPGFRLWINSALAAVLCYMCISLLLQTRDNFRFILPYVEFSKDVKGLKPYLLDTSAVIDGRIADVLSTWVFDNPIIVPRFVLAELQNIADSSDRLRRTRGRRGLDVLNRLRAQQDVDLQIYEAEPPSLADQPVDLKLVLLAKHLGGRVVTNDYNLNKVAQLHGIGVINVNELSNSLKPNYAAGEPLDLRIIKAGEEPDQGVGYLDDGTMIVVEGGRPHVNHNVRVVVTSVLQTSAGRMIFGRFERRHETDDEKSIQPDTSTTQHDEIPH